MGIEQYKFYDDDIDSALLNQWNIPNERIELSIKPGTEAILLSKEDVIEMAIHYELLGVGARIVKGGGKMSEWISVEAGLPEKDGNYLVTTGDEIFINRICTFMDFNGDSPYRGWRDAIRPAVTHWMSLPSPPKPAAQTVKENKSE